jgi:hypothetical protein
LCLIGLLAHNVPEMGCQRGSLGLGSKALLTSPAAPAPLVTLLLNDF